MNQVWAVVRREYLERVRTKGFIITTLIVPLIMVGLMAFSLFMGTRLEQSEPEMAIVDYTRTLGTSVAEGLGAVGFSIELAEPSGVAVAELNRRLVDDEIVAYLMLDNVTASQGTFIYRSKNEPDRVLGALVKRIVAEAASAARSSHAAIPEDRHDLLNDGRLVFQPVDREGVADSASLSTRIKLLGLGGAFLLFMSTTFYGTAVLMSVMSERANRVAEVVIVSVRPWRLLLGKMMGVGAMGLTQLGIWLACAVLLGVVGLPLVAVRISVVDTQQILSFLPGAGILVQFLAFVVLGYLLYSGLYAAVGAICDKEEDAQQLQMPVIMFTAIAFGLQTASMNGPDAEWLNWLALFPFFTPILMFPRVVAGTVPAWMPMLSLVLMAFATIGTAWTAGRLYQTGTLMQGKRPTLKEIVRWLRARPSTAVLDESGPGNEPPRRL